LKHLVFIISTVIIAPVTLLYYLVNAAVPGNKTFSGFTQLLSLFPGRTGNYLRLGFYCFTLKHCDREVVISFLAQFAQQDTELYAGVYIGPQCNIGSCVINKNTLLGSGVHVMSGKNQHSFDDLDMPIKDQGGKYEKISMGENCWIGNGALVMASIGDHCIIAAGSVVIDDIPDYSIAAGNPAKILKSRK
jgi:acetyltransferase-like isoleucine patch superfamily enzyme